MVLHELDLIREAVSGLCVGGGGGDGGGDGQQQVTTWRPSTTPVTIPRRKRGCGWNGDVQQKGQFVALGSRIPCPAWHALVCVFLFFASVRNSGGGGCGCVENGTDPCGPAYEFSCRRVFLASHLMTITTFQPVVCEREREKKKIGGRRYVVGGGGEEACLQQRVEVLLFILVMTWRRRRRDGGRERRVVVFFLMMGGSVGGMMMMVGMEAGCLLLGRRRCYCCCCCCCY